MARFYRSCQRCGFNRPASETSREWTGLIVCTDTCLDERNRQDLVRGRRDHQRVPHPRPPPDPIFVTGSEVTHHAFPGEFDGGFGGAFS